MPFKSPLIMQAWYFASKHHKGQLYPGEDKLPYLTHIGAVVFELLPALEEKAHLDGTLALCCAILHDTVEDTGVCADEISTLFGEATAAGVAALSKNKNLHGLEATRDSLYRIRQQPQEIWLVKLADRSANLRTPPAHWSKDKCHSYAEEGQVILDALGEASPLLALILEKRIRCWKDISELPDASFEKLRRQTATQDIVALLGHALS
ncbi:MAG: bifunctional (p)ppGpp synthetase/guanosine-3',5'-bis(diphosphate) 3'-pyrophosphohydrolase [Desulfovibrio sp.]|nr:bifunctional (p)ppGpp synthetase/guanosine-3',5'-bis(diphosphate) 3'-pyrophosphohydrolase [Desulfovibrio sp.]